MRLRSLLASVGSMGSRLLVVVVIVVVIVAALALPLRAAEPPAASSTDVQPDNSGLWKVVAASWVGADGDDEIVAAGIGADGSILLAGNSSRLDWGKEMTTVIGEEADRQEVSPPADTKKARDWHHPDTFGFVARLSPDGRKPLHLTRFGRGAAEVRRMKPDAKGNVVLLAYATGGVKGAGAEGTGTFLAALPPDGSKVAWATFQPGLTGVDVDADGDVLAVSAGHLFRFGPDGKIKWDATYASHGENRPGAVGVSVRTGAAVVVGYGMTRTGKEPYKDPFAHAFNRDGKPLWSLWNPDPTREKGAQFGGNGLMADTTGRGVGTDPGGNFYLTLYADGGNSVCARDPLDPDKPLDGAVFDGVFQKSPGYGFKGASRTSVVFRVDATTGAIQKGTWLCAWLDQAHANGLGIEAVAGDDRGNVLAAGSSASGCPTKQPWYAAPPGGYAGGGFLAVFDPGFRMQQCGYFPGTQFKCLARRGDTVVVAGSAVAQNKPGPKDSSAAPTYPVPTYRPFQRAFGGGERDGYFVVLRGPSDG